jgi:hypothetical protein
VSAVTVDIVDASSQPGVASDLGARLTRAGYAVGTITTSGPQATSAVRYPVGRTAQAQQLAHALGLAAPPQQAGVRQVTVVLGSEDASALVAALACAG